MSATTATIAAPIADGGTNLISLVNRLHDSLLASGSARGHQIALQLPQIAVVGAQSAGKSSVLEAFVGRDFLPRGAGICTRRPLVLQLVQARSEDPNLPPPAEYAVFAHKPMQTFYDFDQVRHEIEVQTDVVAGTEKGVSPQPINLKIYSPNVIDLTLVDLPGLTKVPVGKQPVNIESIIRSMCLSYVERDNCLILAVSSANIDLATSDALQLAQSVDPDGDRTIGVLTKLDIVDHGTDVRPVLDNKVIPLQFGYIGVVCRSQKQIDTNTRMADAQAHEAKFFSTHPCYSPIASRCGTAYLRQQLHNLLLVHIAGNLPDFKLSIQQQLAELEAKLANCQLDFDYDNPHWKTEALTTFVLRWADTFSTQLVGNSEVGLNLSELTSGARISHLFRQKFKHDLLNTEFTEEEQLKVEIGFAIQCILGVRSGLFTPNMAFEAVVRKQIMRMRDAIEQLVSDVTFEMKHSVTEACSSVGLDRFPALQSALQEAAIRHVEMKSSDAHDAVMQLVDFETAYINTRHEDFVGFSYAEQKAFSRVIKRRNPGKEVVHKGWLKNQDTSAWHVLTPDTLTWYNDETEKVRMYSVPLNDDQLYLQHVRNTRFTLFSKTGNIVLDRTHIDLVAPDMTQLHKWQQSFIQVGIYSEGQSAMPPPQTTSHKVLQTDDPVLERQIESVFLLVDSYMQIVCRTFMDLAPKCIVKTLIKDSITHFRHKFLSELNRADRLDELLEEDSAAIENRRNLESNIAICRDTLSELSALKLPNVIKRKKPERLVVGTIKGSSGSNKTPSGGPSPRGPSPRPPRPPMAPQKSAENANLVKQQPPVNMRKVDSTPDLERNKVARNSGSKDLKKMLNRGDSSGPQSKFFV